MGIYDFFKGTCPKCGKQIDQDEDGEKIGAIQTKIFLNPLQKHCFRSFYPGQYVPFNMNTPKITIGRTVCCNTNIAAIFDGSLLVGYEVVQ